MDFTKVEVLSAQSGVLLPQTYPSIQAATTATFDQDGNIVFDAQGVLFRLTQPIVDYLWVELTFAAKSMVSGSVNFFIYTMDGQALPALQGGAGIEQGTHSEFVFKVPYIGTLQELQMYVAGVPSVGFVGQAILKSIRVVKNSDNLTIQDAVAIGRGSLTNCAPLVYNAALGCYEGALIPGQTVFATVNFFGLVKGTEIGVVRVKHTSFNGALNVVHAAADSYVTDVFAEEHIYTYSADTDLNIYPSGVFLTNNGPTAAHVRIYVQLGSFLDANLNVFGGTPQPVGTPASLYNPLGSFASLAGFLFAAAGTVTAYPTIPVTLVDFTAGVVPTASINTLTVNTTATIKDLKVTRTGINFGNMLGSMFYMDAGGYTVPTNGDRLSYRWDLGAGAMGLGVAPFDGALLTLDGSGTGSSGAAPRYGVKLFIRSITAADTGVYGYYTDLNAPNIAVTLPFIYHFSANQSIALGVAGLTLVRGFYAANSIAKGVTNSGFYSDINNASNTFQLNMAGTAPSVFSGTLAIGTAVGGTTTNGFRFGLPSTVNSVDAWAGYGLPLFPNSTTNSGGVFVSEPSTAATVFTVPNLYHFWAKNTTKGATSTITNTYGFFASTNIVQGTTSVGFGSDIANAANTFALRFTGTGKSLFSGSVGIGTTAGTTESLLVDGNINTLAGTTNFGINVAATVPLGATAAYGANASNLTTQNTAVTYAVVAHYWARLLSKGAASTVTSVMGFYANDTGFTGAANSYGFYSDIASGSGKFQMALLGSALSIMQGGLVLATTAAPTVAASQLSLGATVATTVGAAGGASALPATPLGYWIINVAGTQVKVPYFNN